MQYYIVEQRICGGLPTCNVHSWPRYFHLRPNDATFGFGCVNLKRNGGVVQRIPEVDELTHKRLGASRQQGVSTSAVRWRNDTVTPRPGWSMETIGENRPFRARVSIPIEYLATSLVVQLEVLAATQVELTDCS